MWAISNPKAIEKKSKVTLPLEKYLAMTRAQFLEERKQVPELLKKAKDMKVSLNSMNARYLYRKKKDTEKLIQDIEKEADLRLSMQRETEYEQTIAPYITAYNQRVEMTSSNQNEVPRNITAPGAGKKRETIDMYVQQSDATASRQTTIVNEYLMQTNNEAPKLALHTRDDCPMCHETLKLVNSKAIMTCPKCGYAVTYLDATMQSMSYSDDVEFSSFSYKRINHFNEWLQQVQAKENFEISEETLENIMIELYRQRIHKAEDITQKKVREVLKILKLRKSYEHVAQITSRLTGERPMRIPPEAEETCRLMFIAVQPAFEKHCPKDRKNFLSYSYCLYKFFQLLGYDEFLDSFTLLKGRDKLTKQDEIFKKICEELDWEFLPSV
tara:strand:- start:813 stop:1964 length:1152 start_codon:yes stop_codon:yes gene_type:complete